MIDSCRINDTNGEDTPEDNPYSFEREVGETMLSILHASFTLKLQEGDINKNIITLGRHKEATLGHHNQ